MGLQHYCFTNGVARLAQQRAPGAPDAQPARPEDLRPATILASAFQPTTPRPYALETPATAPRLRLSVLPPDGPPDGRGPPPHGVPVRRRDSDQRRAGYFLLAEPRLWIREEIPDEYCARGSGTRPAERIPSWSCGVITRMLSATHGEQGLQLQGRPRSDGHHVPAARLLGPDGTRPIVRPAGGRAGVATGLL